MWWVFFSHISTKEEILVQELFDKALRKSFDFEWQIPYFHLNGNWQLFPHKWWLRYGWDYVTIEQKWFNHESILCISFEIKKNILSSFNQSLNTKMTTLIPNILKTVYIYPRKHYVVNEGVKSQAYLYKILLKHNSS